MIANDVAIIPIPPKEPTIFEDWYVDPKIIPRKVINAYKWIDFSGRPKYYTDILFKPNAI